MGVLLSEWDVFTHVGFLKGTLSNEPSSFVVVVVVVIGNYKAIESPCGLARFAVVLILSNKAFGSE